MNTEPMLHGSALTYSHPQGAPIYKEKQRQSFVKSYIVKNKIIRMSVRDFSLNLTYTAHYVTGGRAVYDVCVEPAAR